MFDYMIPDDIKRRIPEYFYYALGGECVSVMGADALIRDKDGLSCLDYSAGTAGYVEAFRITCKKLDMDWLFEYWDSLPWYQSDIFDGEISDEVIRCFDKKEHMNAYYHYLISMKGE